MKYDRKSVIFLVLFGVTLFAALSNLGKVMSAVGKVAELLLPILIGLVLAFILNVPMKVFEGLYGKIGAKRGKPLSRRLVCVLSLLSTLLALVLIFWMVGSLLVPELTKSVRSATSMVRRNWPVWTEWVAGLPFDTTEVTEWMSGFNIREALTLITDNIGLLYTSALDIVTTTVSLTGTVVVALVLSIYVLLTKDKLGRGMKRLLYANLKDGIADTLVHIGTLASETYFHFFTGQCLEACILGTMIFLSFKIFGLPYAGLTAVLTCISAFIPYVGAFSACALGALLTLIAAPEKVLISIIVYIVTQFCENQFVYPHVVGSSVGLSPLWTLAAVVVGGDLMGLLGMIFFIPLTAVIFRLGDEWVEKRMMKKYPDYVPAQSEEERPATLSEKLRALRDKLRNTEIRIPGLSRPAKASGKKDENNAGKKNTSK